VPPDLRSREPAASERLHAPVSADSTGAAIAADRPLDSTPAPGTAAATGLRAIDGDPVRVAIVGATGYVGAELVRLLARHPNATIVGLVGRERHGDPLAGIHPHLATEGLRVFDAVPDDAEAVFLALPHGAAAARIDEFGARGLTVIDLGPDFRLRDPEDYPRWYHLDHPRPELLETAVYGLPELHRAALAAAGEKPNAIVGAPGCYATTTILALAPLARAGLIGDLVVDAKSGVSGAGRDAKPDLMFGEVNESVKAYGIFTHRHIGEIEQELGALGGGLAANPGVRGVDFLPHLIPMTRGILSAGHVRTTRAVTQAELDDLYHDAYGEEPFVTVTEAAPATKHVLGSNEARVWCRLDERNGRVLAIGVLDNLVKGAAGQAIQAFNVVHGLPETAGLLQLPLAP
jgi:N-acetyl-gamma-glutamyl-phosphate reductase